MKKWLRYLIIFTTTTGLIGSVVSSLMSDRPLFYTVALLKYFTIWSNIFALCYMLFLPRKIGFFEKTKGGIYINISITMIVFILLLSHTWQPSGIDAYSNIMHHYVSPSLMLIYLFLYERDGNFSLVHVKMWLVFPLSYFVFSIFLYAISGNPVYPFLDIEQLGIPMVSLIISSIFIFYLVLSFIFVKIVSRK